MLTNSAFFLFPTVILMNNNESNIIHQKEAQAELQISIPSNEDTVLKY